MSVRLRLVACLLVVCLLVVCWLVACVDQLRFGLCVVTVARIGGFLLWVALGCCFGFYLV